MRRYAKARILIAHFFRRFFDNDTVQPDGDTTTSVVRAIAAVAAPGLMFAFFLQTHYPGRAPWGAIQDQYFFVLFSFVAMGTITTFAGEMLFPDRIDFLVLTPLPLRHVEALVAKAAALAGFLLLFLSGSNFFGTLLYPAIAVAKGRLWGQLYAHGVAVALAGAFAALSVLALNGIMLCVLDGARFRLASPLFQMVSVSGFLLLLFHYAKYGDWIRQLLTEPLGVARWLPPLWFLALYDHLLYGAAAPRFAQALAGYASRGTLGAAIVVLITYPLAWAQTRRRVLEGASQSRRQRLAGLSRIFHWVIVNPAGRALFHFIGQTIRRNTRYQIYLAIYGGTGLALAIACATVLLSKNSGVEIGLSATGLRAVLPLLLFWVVAGMRTAFAFPLNLQAAWVFRITGGDSAACTAAARTWVMLAATAVMGGILAIYAIAGLSWRQLLVQTVCGACLTVLLTDGFFFQRSIPFTRPRMPGRTNFPLMLTLYVGALTPFIYGVLALEKYLEQNLFRLLLPAAVTAAVHVAVSRLHKAPMEIEEQMEGYEGEFQLLGLG